MDAFLPVSSQFYTRENIRAGLILLAISFFISLSFTHLIVGTNDGSRYSLTRALVERHSMEIGGIYEGMVGSIAIDKAIFHGRTYSDKAPLPAFLGVPVYALVRQITAREYWQILAVSATISALPAAICAFLIFFLCLSYGASRSLSALLGFSAVWGTNLGYWSTRMFSHSLDACLITACFFFLRFAVDRRYLWLAGLVGGLAVSSDYYLILLLPLFCGWTVKNYGKDVLWFVFGAAVAGIFPAVYHQILFGNPLVLPYHYSAFFRDIHQQGIYGLRLPSLYGILDILAGPNYGIFVYNPLLLGALVAAITFRKRFRGDAILLFSLLVVMVVMNSGHPQKSYGYGRSWGPRYQVAIFPLLLLPLAMIQKMSRRQRLFCAVCGGLSIALNLYLITIFYLPPANGAFSALFIQGPKTLMHYGPLNIWAQWLALYRQYHPLISTVLTLGMAGLIAWIWHSFLLGPDQAKNGFAVTAEPESVDNSDQ